MVPEVDNSLSTTPDRVRPGESSRGTLVDSGDPGRDTAIDSCRNCPVIRAAAVICHCLRLDLMPYIDLPIPPLQLEDTLRPCHQIVSLSSNFALPVPTDCTPSSSPCFPLPPTITNVSDLNHRRTHTNLASFPQTSSTMPDMTPSGPYTNHLSSITRRLTNLSLSSAGARPTHPKPFRFDGNKDPQQVLVFINIDVHQLIIENLTRSVHPCWTQNSFSLRHSPFQPPVTRYKIPRCTHLILSVFYHPFCHQPSN